MKEEVAVRLLIAARLSQVRKGQTGIDTQDQDAKAWAEANGHAVVAVVADKISGRVSPFKRPNLGPWLTDPALMAQYDGVLGSKMDRLTRGRDWGIRQWAEEQGKKLLVASPELMWPPEPGDLTTPMMWDVLVNVASAEWENTSVRYRRMQRSLRENGYLVGRPPFGFAIMEVPGTEHSTLVPDPATAPYVVGMVDRALAGDTLSSIGAWLDREGVLPPSGKGRWSPKSVGQIIRNPALIGRRTQGRTALRFEGIVDPATWRAAVAKLDSNPRRRGAISREPALLTGIIRCPKCNRIMHYRESVKTRKDGRRHVNAYYRCDGTPQRPSTCRNMVPAEIADRVASDAFTGARGPEIGQFADREMVEVVVVPGHGHEDELAENAREIAELDPDAPDYDAQLATLRSERKRLQALPGTPDRVEERSTGIKVRDHWSSLDTAGRRAFLLACGIEFYMSRDISMFGSTARKVEAAVRMI